MESLFNQTFPSFQEAQAACDTIARAQGFALAVAAKKPSAASPAYIYLRCSKGRKYINYSNEAIAKRRKTSTQMTQCSYRLILKLDHLRGLWSVSTPLGAAIADHNHPFIEPMAHAKYKREVITKYSPEIIQLYNNGLRPVHIAAQLRSRSGEDPELAGISVKQVHNALAQHRQEELAGRTPLQFLYDNLEKSDFFIRDARDRTGRLSTLFLAPRSGIELLRQFPDVWQLDCTYKTNRFNMPLLNICGTTHTKRTFSIASVFLSGEAESEYRWAITALLTLLAKEDIKPPQVIVTDRELALINALTSFQELENAAHLLCRWHISKNVLAKCKSYFPKATRNTQGQIERAPSFTSFLQDWEKLISSESVNSFNQQLQQFKAAHPAAAVRYTLQTWLEPWKEKIVTCFVNQHRHFGHTTTSIVEGLHSSMKRFLWSSTGDLLTVFKKFLPSGSLSSYSGESIISGSFPYS